MSKRTTFDEVYCKKLVTESSGSSSSFGSNITFEQNITVDGDATFDGGGTFTNGDYEVGTGATLSIDNGGEVDLDGAFFIFGNGYIATHIKGAEGMSTDPSPISSAVAALSEAFYDVDLSSNSVDIPLTIDDPGTLGNNQTFKFYVAAHSGDGTNKVTISPDGSSCELASGSADIDIQPSSGLSETRVVILHKPAAGGLIQVF